MKLKLLLFSVLLLAVSGSAFAQGVRYDNFVLKPLAAGGVTPVSGALVTVCTSTGSGTPCTPKVANIYSDQALTTPITGTGGAGTTNSDANGNYGFYIAPGDYVVTVTGSGITSTTVKVTLPCTASSGCTFTGPLTAANMNGIVFVDGVTHTTIQSAINALPSTGGTVFIPAGSYTFSSGLTISGFSGTVILRGAGRESTTLTSSDAVNPAITLNSPHARVEDVRITSSVSAATTTGISVGSSCSACRVSDVVVDGHKILISDGAENLVGNYLDLNPCSSASGSIGFSQGSGADDTQLSNIVVNTCGTLVQNLNSGGPIQISNAILSNGATTFLSGNLGIYCSNCHLFNQATGAITNWITQTGGDFYFSNSVFEDARSSGTEANCGTVTSGILALSNVSFTNSGAETCTVMFSFSGSGVASFSNVTNYTPALIPAIYNAAWPRVSFLGYHTASDIGSQAPFTAVSVTAAGAVCTNGELALSAGWQSTGTATVTNVKGNGQTCEWTITTGTTTAANPTVTDTLTNALPNATTVCEMIITGGNRTPAAGDSFDQTTLSATAPVFTFQGTPTPAGKTYQVVRRCGP